MQLIVAQWHKEGGIAESFDATDCSPLPHACWNVFEVQHRIE